MATILIVDDHVLNRQFLLALLGFDKHRLLQAVDGADGLALAGAERPDLIITDIMMPKMDGYEFIRRMRADPALAATPVMFYTSTYDLCEANAIAQACAVRWVRQKPSAPEVILAAVHRALSLPARSDAAFAAALPAAEKGRFGSLDRKIASYLHDLGTGSDIVARIDAGAPERAASLPQVAQRLRQSLSDFQAMGLRLTALIDLGIELASERDRQRLIETGCKIARHIGVARYAVIAIVEPDAGGPCERGSRPRAHSGRENSGQNPRTGTGRNGNRPGQRQHRHRLSPARHASVFRPAIENRRYGHVRGQARWQIDDSHALGTA